MEQKEELLKVVTELLTQADKIKCLINPEIDNSFSEMYPMCKVQFAQIDCRFTSCKYYKGSGNCSNIAPAIVLNQDGTFWCKSKQE